MYLLNTRVKYSHVSERDISASRHPMIKVNVISTQMALKNKSYTDHEGDFSMERW